jgi:hypothetical protein
MQNSRMAAVMCAVAGMATACAGYRAPDRIISTEWTTVEALAPGTTVSVMLRDDDVRAGTIMLVTDHDLTIKEERGLSNLSRANVRRVSLRQYTGADHTDGMTKGAALGGLAGIPLAVSFATRSEEHSMGGAEVAAVLVGMGIGAIAGSYATPGKRFEDRVVYIHQ